MDFQKVLQDRVDALIQEGNKVAQEAARQAAIPYEAAISELKRLLEMAQKEENDKKE